MLPAKNRIKKGFLPSILKQSRPFASAYFVLRVHYRNNNGLENMVPLPPRASIVVAKKVAPKAVDRNLIRRRVSAVLAGYLAKISDIDLVLIVQKNPLEKNFVDLSQEIVALLRQAKLVK